MKKIYLTLICFSLYSFTYAQDIDFLLPDSEILSMMFPESRIENNEAEWEGEDNHEETQVLKTFVRFKEFYIQDGFVKCLVFTESNYNMCNIF